MTRKKMPACGNMRDWLTADDSQMTTAEMIIPGAAIIALVFIGCAVLSALHLMGVW